MTAQAISQYLQKEVFPREEELLSTQGGDSHELDALRSLPRAIIRSLDKDGLHELNAILEEGGNTPEYYIWLTDHYLKEEPTTKATVNEPIATLLRYYKNKQSGKVEYARAQLKKRIDAQSDICKRQILSAFMAGTKADVQWSLPRLKTCWHKSLVPLLKQCWEDSPTESAAKAVAALMPEQYVADHASGIEALCGYDTVCLRLGKSDSFEIDEEKLGPAKYLYVMAKLGRSISAEDVERRVMDYILDYGLTPLLHGRPGILAMGNMDLIVWSLSRMGMTDLLMRIDELDRIASKEASRVDTAAQWPVFVHVLKREIKPAAFGKEELIQELSDYFASGPFEPEENVLKEDCVRILYGEKDAIVNSMPEALSANPQVIAMLDDLGA